VTVPGPGGQQRRRLEPDARREQILAVAVRMFAQGSYSEVSTSEIAAQAGVARGLINHYFATKQDLYHEVVRALVTIPDVAVAQVPRGPLPQRVDASVSWFLDTVQRHDRAWLAATSAGGAGGDPTVAAILAAADERAADQVLEAMGLEESLRLSAAERDRLRALLRAYFGMAKAAAREWLVRGALGRDDVHALLTQSLLTVLTSTFPAVRPRAGPSAGRG
jgi:AcrR family transcriptional regulator